MKNKTLLSAGHAGFLVCLTFLTACTGYAAEGVQVHASATIQDDYDYFPASETYYSRNRQEFVYNDGNAWVRRPEPRGTTAAVILATPSVRMDFRDSPESHHSAVVKSYPKDWKRPEANHDSKDDHRDDKKDDGRKN